MRRIFLFVTVLFVMASCQPVLTRVLPSATPLPTPTVVPPMATAIPNSTLTLTIRENNCSLDGPSTVPHAELTINFSMDEQKPTESGYALFTLKEGKTIEDVKAWPSVNQPPWINLIQGVHEFTNGLHTYTYDYTHVATNQTLYLVCFRANPDTGEIARVGGPFGPIEVK
jgi:hypothetical protein